MSALRFSGCASGISLESPVAADESAAACPAEVSPARGAARGGLISPNAATCDMETPAGTLLLLVFFAAASLAELEDGVAANRAESGGLIRAASAAAWAVAFAISFAWACFATVPTSRARSWR